MSKTLLLFLSSDNANSYVNAIAHSFDTQQVTAVKLIHIRGNTTGLSDVEASTLSNQIWRQIEALSSGSYLDFKSQTAHDSIQPLTHQPLVHTAKIGIYQRINERLQDRQLVPLVYSNLKDGINQLVVRQGGSRNCLIDLTGTTKVPAIDIFSVCLALGIQSVFTFELKDRADPKNPEKSLYHVLRNDQFSYTCLTITEPVVSSKAALYRRSSLLWSVGALALLLTIVSLYIYIVIGSQSSLIQLINLVAAIVGIVSPLWAFIEQRRQ